jgi:hypothetical protein
VTVLLHVYHPDKRPEDQTGTWRALATINWPVCMTIEHYETVTDYSYADALMSVWEYPGDVLVLEQDIVPTWDHVDELLHCTRPYCAWDFRLAHGILWSEVPGGHGFGLAKFSEEARHSIIARPKVQRLSWPDTVPALHERLAPVHVHQPCIEHHHGLA